MPYYAKNAYLMCCRGAKIDIQHSYSYYYGERDQYHCKEKIFA